MTEEKVPYITAVLGCARCGEDHEQVSFYPFTNPVVDEDGTVWGWWGDCPNTDEPILLKMETDET